MTSLQIVARELGLTDEGAADILGLTPPLREIGLENYIINDPMAAYIRKLLTNPPVTD